jgi:hypothetical protein
MDWPGFLFAYSSIYFYRFRYILSRFYHVLSRTHAGAEIRAGNVIHPLGKTIFVFAGWEEEKETLNRPI